MHPEQQRDILFETGFFEAVLRRDRNYTEVIEILGGLYTKQGRIADGLKMDRRLVKLQPDNATAHYNLACSLALMKKKAEAIKTLKHAVDLGYKDFRWMAKDRDLESLKDNPEFRRMLERDSV